MFNVKTLSCSRCSQGSNCSVVRTLIKSEVQNRIGLRLKYQMFKVCARFAPLLARGVRGQGAIWSLDSRLYAGIKPGASEQILFQSFKSFNRCAPFKTFEVEEGCRKFMVLKLSCSRIHRWPDGLRIQPAQKPAQAFGKIAITPRLFVGDSNGDGSMSATKRSASLC